MSSCPSLSRILDGRPLIVHARERQAGEDQPLHSHPEGQLWAITAGLVVARLEHGNWVLPAHRVGWIPPGVPHAGQARRSASGWLLYLRADLCGRFPATPTVFDINPVSLALLGRIAQWQVDGTALSRPRRRMLHVLFDELMASATTTLYLPMPESRQLLALALAIAADPSAPGSLADWAGRAAMSTRSFSRHFHAETGLSFAQWRTRARMKRALELLADGRAVTQVAFELGYDSPSTFIASFRAQFGATPGVYLQTAIASQVSPFCRRSD